MKATRKIASWGLILWIISGIFSAIDGVQNGFEGFLEATAVGLIVLSFVCLLCVIFATISDRHESR